MTFLLDTDVCIDFIRQKPQALIRKLQSCPLGAVATSCVTVAELEYGVARSSSPERNQAALDEFLLPLAIVPFDTGAARVYGPLRAHLEGKGTPIGSLDLLIAAQALASGLTVVTRHVREFRRVPNLRVEIWP